MRSLWWAAKEGGGGVAKQYNLELNSNLEEDDEVDSAAVDASFHPATSKSGYMTAF